MPFLPSNQSTEGKSVEEVFFPPPHIFSFALSFPHSLLSSCPFCTEKHPVLRYYTSHPAVSGWICCWNAFCSLSAWTFSVEWWIHFISRAILIAFLLSQQTRRFVLGGHWSVGSWSSCTHGNGSVGAAYPKNWPNRNFHQLIVLFNNGK